MQQQTKLWELMQQQQAVNDLRVANHTGPDRER